MPHIAYETELEVGQPWLIETKSLEELDAVIDTCIAKIRDRIPAEIEREANEYVERYFDGSSLTERMERFEFYQTEKSASKKYRVVEKTVTVFLSGGRTAVGTTFKELLILPNVQKERARGFRYRAQLGEAVVDVGLSDSYGRALKARISPGESELSTELFGIVQNWISEIQPPKWQQIWFNVSWLFRMCLIFWVFLPAIIVSDWRENPGKDALKQEAVELAKHGVDSTNQTRAIQLILALESGYTPDASAIKPKHDLKGWLYVFLLSLGWIVLCFPPKGAIGMWGGRRDVRLQRNWTRFVCVTIPTLLVSGFLIPWIRRGLGGP